MKGKLKSLSGPALKNFFLQHGEKIAMAAVAVVLVMFIVKAVGRETLSADKEPDRLKDAASGAQSHIAASKLDTAPFVVSPGYVTRARRDPVNSDQYALPVAWDPQIFESKRKRDDPAIYPLEEPRVVSSYGLFSMNEAGPGERQQPGAGGARRPMAQEIDGEGNPLQGGAGKPGATAGSAAKGVYWALVTGVVPLKKQLGEYQRAFQRSQAQDKDRDTPNYLGYMIERAEIGPDGKALAWVQVDKKAIAEFAAKWAYYADEVAVADTVDLKLAADLGPLLNRTWGTEVVHPPQVKPATEVKQAEAEQNQPADDGEQKFDAFGNPIAPKQPVKGPVRAMPGRPQDRKDKPVVDFKLFRFFDFTVEPGKRYKYRIQLGLANPNFDVLPRFLKKAESATVKFRLTEWSAETPIVQIPRGDQILAGPPPARKPTDTEPQATLMLIAFDKDRGMQAVTKETGRRGAVMNFKKDVMVKDPLQNKLVEQKGVDFSPNALVLDIRGGRQLPGKDKLTEPSEVLLLDAEGRLVSSGELLARTEIDDAAAFTANDVAAETPVPAAGGGGLTASPFGVDDVGGLTTGNATKAKPAKNK